jgi:hypothetical protein
MCRAAAYSRFVAASPAQFPQQRQQFGVGGDAVRELLIER